MAYTHTSGLTVSCGGSSCRPVTNTASSLPDRISGCSSGKEALGIILLMSDAHLVPFPDVYPPGSFSTCDLSQCSSLYLFSLFMSGEAPARMLLQAYLCCNALNGQKQLISGDWWELAPWAVQLRFLHYLTSRTVSAREFPGKWLRPWHLSLNHSCRRAGGSFLKG